MNLFLIFYLDSVGITTLIKLFVTGIYTENVIYLLSKKNYFFKLNFLLIIFLKNRMKKE